MRSRVLLLTLLAFLGVVLDATPGTAATQPRVALVVSGAIGPFVDATSALRAALERAVQPEILLLDLENSREKAAALPELLAEAQPALVITVGSFATAAALAARPAAPVVFSMVLYPEQSGFLPANGRAVTGAMLDVPLDEQFAMTRRLLPSAKRVGVVYSVAETRRVVEAARAAARKHGFELEARTVEEPGQTPRAVEALLEEVDLLWTVADGRVLTAQTTSALLLAALRRGVPVFGLSAAHVRAGALAALSSDYADVGVQTAELAIRVLKGEPAGQIPPTAPRKISLALNLRTAKHLGLTIDERLEHEAAVVVR
jgi:putative ABC transport system substrate-binding protein